MTPEPAVGAGLSAASLRERYQQTFRDYLRERDEEGRAAPRLRGGDQQALRVVLRERAEEGWAAAPPLRRETVPYRLSVLGLAAGLPLAVESAMRDAPTPEEQADADEDGAEVLRGAL